MRKPIESPMMLSRAAHEQPEMNALPLPDGPAETEGGGAVLSATQAIVIARAYWKQSALIFVALIAVSTVAIKLLPKSYTATATLKVDSDLRDPLAGLQNSIEQRGGYIPTEMQLMETAGVLMPVIEKLGLDKDKHYTAGFTGDPAFLRVWVKEQLTKDLEISQGAQGSLLINVTATAREPLLAASIANAVVDSYMAGERKRIDEPAKDRAERYTAQLAELKAKVSAAEDQVAEYRQRTGITDPIGQKSGESDTLTALENRLDQARNARREAEVRAQDGSSANAETTAARARVETLRGSLASQETQLAQLRTTLGARHPRVVELESQMEATRRNIANEMQSYARTANADLASARELENKLEAAVEKQREKVLAVGKVQDDGNKLALELESAKSVYKRALDGYDQIMFASAAHHTYVNLVSRATPPIKSTKPNKIKLLLMAIMASIGAGVVIPFAYELFLNRRVRSTDDLEHGFQIPVLIELDQIRATVPT